MTYQVKHKTFGLYQGSWLGFGFWHPMSEMPEQGICKFPNENKAKKFIDFLCNEASDKLNRKDLSIESFDEELNKKLLEEGIKLP